MIKILILKLISQNKINHRLHLFLAPSSRRQLDAVPGHVPHSLAVEALDVLPAPAAVRPFPAPPLAGVLLVEVLVPKPCTRASETEASEAALALVFLLPLLLLLPESLDLLLLLLIPGQVLLDKILHGLVAELVSNLQPKVLVIYLFLSFLDQTSYFLWKTLLKMLLQLHLQIVSKQVFHLGIKIELLFTARF